MSEQTQEPCVLPKEEFTCKSVVSKYADVSVPLKLKPCAAVGEITTECCGEPLLALRPCQGAAGSCGCEIVITQTVCIRIPLTYGAQADVGEISASCGKQACRTDCGGRW